MSSSSTPCRAEKLSSTPPPGCPQLCSRPPRRPPREPQTRTPRSASSVVDRRRRALAPCRDSRSACASVSVPRSTTEWPSAVERLEDRARGDARRDGRRRRRRSSGYATRVAERERPRDHVVDRVAELLEHRVRRERTRRSARSRSSRPRRRPTASSRARRRPRPRAAPSRRAAAPRRDSRTAAPGRRLPARHRDDARLPHPARASCFAASTDSEDLRPRRDQDQVRQPVLLPRLPYDVRAARHTLAPRALEHRQLLARQCQPRRARPRARARPSTRRRSRSHRPGRTNQKNGIARSAA